MNMILVSHVSEIHPEKEYPELSAIYPNEMHYGTKSVVGNVPASIQKMQSKNISRLHTDRDVCKESTDTSRKATQGCSATLNPIKRFRNPLPMATGEDGYRVKNKRNPTNSFVGGCQSLLENDIYYTN